MIITGAECAMCGGAGSDGQLHMAFPPRALLMLEAVVGCSQRQQGGGGFGGGLSSCHLPHSEEMGNPERYALQKCNT